MSEIVIEAADLVEVLTKDLGHGSPYSPQELASLPRIIFREDAPYRLLEHFTGIRRVAFPDWDGVCLGALDKAARLTKVSILRSSVTDISALATCPQLEYIHFERCPISDISVLSQLTQLEELTITECLVEDLTPIVELVESGAPLRQLTIGGNPVSQASLDALRAALERRGDIKATLLSDETAQAARHVVPVGLPVTVQHITDDGRLKLTAIGGFRPGYRNDHAFLPPAELERLLATHAGDIEAFWPEARRVSKANAKPPRKRPPRFSWKDHTEFGDATVARGWIESSALAEPDQAVLFDFVSRFAAQRFCRYSQAYLDEFTRCTGTELPQWYAEHARTLVAPNGFLVTEPRSQAREHAISLGFDPNNDQSSFNEYNCLFIGWDQRHYNLCLNTGDETDRRVYEGYKGESWSGLGDVTRLFVAFPDYLELLRRCWGLGEFVDGELVITEQKHRPRV